MANLTSSAARKPFSSGSPIFDAAHESFLDDIFESNVQSVSTVETLTTRELVLADVAKFVAIKKTGEIIVRYRPRYDKPWRAIPNNIGQYWLSRLSATQFFAQAPVLEVDLRSAWEHRLSGYLPSAEVCFPQENLRQKYRSSIFLAVSRRLGKKSIHASMKRRFVSALWNFLADKEVVRLCLRFFGYRATITDYNFTFRFQRCLRQFHTETPQLSPLIGRYLRDTRTDYRRRKKLPLDVVARAKTWLSPEGALPLTPAGWRFLSRQNSAGVERLLWLRNDDHTLLNGICNVLGKSGLKAPYSLLYELRRMLDRLNLNNPKDWETAPEEFTESLTRFLRLVCEQAALAKKKSKLTDFIRNELPLVWDFVSLSDSAFESHHRKLIKLGKGLTWATLWRRQREWHVALNKVRAEQEAIRAAEEERRKQEQRERAERIENATWDFAISSGVIENVQYSALNSTKALRREGKDMQHCVDGLGYTKACMAGNSRIFHLTHGEEQATMELVAEDKRWWSVAQVYGFEDSPASKPMWRAAKKLAVLYRQAQRKMKPAAAAQS